MHTHTILRNSRGIGAGICRDNIYCVVWQASPQTPGLGVCKSIAVYILCPELNDSHICEDTDAYK